jgi:hypothetical protein
MKKNILLLLPFIATSSALSMYKHHLAQQLDQTVMVESPEVTDESLGVIRYFSDWTPEGEANNLYADVENKKYVSTNQQYIDKLDRTVEEWNKTNDPRLPKLLNYCRDYYKGKISIAPSIGLAVHTNFITQKRAKLAALKTTLEDSDKKFLDEQDQLLQALKLSFAQQIAAIKSSKNKYISNRNDLLMQGGNDIRETVKSAAVIRRLSIFTADNEYSDDQSLHPDRVHSTYDEHRLLDIMNVKFTYAIVSDVDVALQFLNQLNRSLGNI